MDKNIQSPQAAQGNDKQHAMTTQPVTVSPHQWGSGKLEGKVALVTGGDSGIGRAVAVAFAREGADIAIGYLDEDTDAQETKRLVEAEGRQCLCLIGDIGEETFCQTMIRQVIEQYGQLDILVNNAAEQHPQDDITAITPEQLERTFRTNVFAMFYLVKAALPHLSEESVIINTASVAAYKGNPELLDYSATKGAVISFTRALSQSLVSKKIRSMRLLLARFGRRSLPRHLRQKKLNHLAKMYRSDVLANPMK